MLDGTLTGLAAVITAGAAWRAVHRVGKEVISPNGIPTGEMIMRIYDKLEEHLSDSNIHNVQPWEYPNDR